MLNARHWAPTLPVLLSLTLFGFSQGTLEKTVSLTPGSPGSGAITVTAGTTVYYTYFLRNGAPMGNGPAAVFTDTVPTLRFQTLTDDKLGTLLSMADITLLPGEMFSVTQPATIETTTTNTATWSAFAEPVTATIRSLRAQVLVFTSTANATVFVAQRTDLPIPTLSEWGVVLLAVLLLGGGLLLLGRANGREPLH